VRLNLLLRSSEVSNVLARHCYDIPPNQGGCNHSYSNYCVWLLQRRASQTSHSRIHHTITKRITLFTIVALRLNLRSRAWNSSTGLRRVRVSVHRLIPSRGKSIGRCTGNPRPDRQTGTTNWAWRDQILHASDHVITLIGITYRDATQKYYVVIATPRLLSLKITL
jgi:hypothetical protein